MHIGEISCGASPFATAVMFTLLVETALALQLMRHVDILRGPVKHPNSPYVGSLGGKLPCPLAHLGCSARYEADGFFPPESFLFGKGFF